MQRSPILNTCVLSLAIFMLILVSQAQSATGDTSAGSVNDARPKRTLAPGGG